MKSTIESENSNAGNDIKVKKKRKNHSQLGPDFIAPDGGYGWLVCLGAGCSNVRHFIILHSIWPTTNKIAKFISPNF